MFIMFNLPSNCWSVLASATYAVSHILGTSETIMTWHRILNEILSVIAFQVFGKL